MDCVYYVRIAFTCYEYDYAALNVCRCVRSMCVSVCAIYV